MRQRVRGVSATRPSGFLFAISQEGLSSLQLGKQAGKGTLESCLSDGFFPKCGQESGDMRTAVTRDAEKKSVYCGKRRAPLRQINTAFAAFSVKPSKQMQINMYNSSLFGAVLKGISLVRMRKMWLLGLKRKGLLSFCLSAACLSAGCLRGEKQLRFAGKLSPPHGFSSTSLWLGFQWHAECASVPPFRASKRRFSPDDMAFAAERATVSFF